MHFGETLSSSRTSVPSFVPILQPGSPAHGSRLRRPYPVGWRRDGFDLVQTEIVQIRRGQRAIDAWNERIGSCCRLSVGSRVDHGFAVEKSR